jgi:RNA recognition motif-containing protein
VSQNSVFTILHDRIFQENDFEGFSLGILFKMPEDAKIHVGNLPFRAREDDLIYEFERYGRVEQGKYLSLLFDVVCFERTEAY